MIVLSGYVSSPAGRLARRGPRERRMQSMSCFGPMLLFGIVLTQAVCPFCLSQMLILLLGVATSLGCGSLCIVFILRGAYR